MAKTFEKYLSDRGKSLRPWQREAANALLTIVADNRHSASGKSFLLRELSQLIDRHGVDFQLEDTEEESCLN